MRILIEEHQYEANLVKEVLHGIDALQDIEGKVSLSYVGYYYNTKLRDCVFILPKVLMNENDRVFYHDEERKGFSPEQLIHFEEIVPELDKKECLFIREFAVWIYRTIAVYKASHPKSDIIYHRQVMQMGTGRLRQASTLLDVILLLVQFNREHRDFITFTLRNIHSGFNKINWTRTIAHSPAIVQGGEPIYLNPVNKKKQVNFDEELLIIFYSILNHIKETYGFYVDIQVGFPLIRGAQFKSYIEGRGAVRLRQIKYKYFSDIALYLWDLCYAFFELAHKINTPADMKEYLLVKNFYIVFEAIIDELIGSAEDKAALPSELTEQKDGKLVDHLYTYKALMQPEDGERQTYYIGDSKYYKIGARLGEHSIYKQYTYARNIIQSNIDLWMDDKREKPTIRVRDDLTEGYSILPNFFISADMKADDFSDTHREVTKTERTEIKYHFPDRLFDRDTLLLSRYNVNFLFVIALYARNRKTEKVAWRDEVRRQFRKEIQEVLNTHYSFYAMKSKGNTLAGERFISDHYRELQGKLYCPFEDKSIYALALERKSREGDEVKDTSILDLLGEHFIIDPLTLGESPKERLDKKVAQHQAESAHKAAPQQFLPQYPIEGFMDACFLIGSYHDQAHWDWITGKNDRGTLIYNVRLDKSRPGAQTKTRLRALKPRFAILYEQGHEHENNYRVFRIHDTAVMDEERMRASQYPRTPRGDYFIFRFDEEISFGRIDIRNLISEKHNNDHNYADYAPIFVTGEQLRAYCLPGK